MSLTLSEIQLVRSIQTVIVEHTLVKELLAEEVSHSPEILSINDNSAFRFRTLLQVGLRPGATVDELSRELAGHRRRTIERLLRNFRGIGVVTAWTRATSKGQWTRSHTSYGKGGPLPMQYWLAGDPSNPLFQRLDLPTRLSLWRVRKFIVGSSEFRDHLRRSILATLRIIQAMKSSGIDKNGRKNP